MQPKPYKIIDLVQGSTPWLEFRRSHVMASDTPKIMGVSPYGSPYSVWLEKMGMGEQKKTSAMDLGNKMETIIRDRINKDLGLILIPIVLESTINTWQGASLDGFDEIKGIAAEIKYANVTDHDIARKHKIPEKYYPQLQKILFVTGFDAIHYISCNSDEIIQLLVVRDEEFIASIFEKEKSFYANMIDFIAPELTEKDYHDLTGDLELVEWIARHKQADAFIKIHEEEKKVFRAKIIERCNNRSITCSGTKITRYPVLGRIDYSIIEELEGVDLEKYRKPSTISYRIN